MRRPSALLSLILLSACGLAVKGSQYDAQGASGSLDTSTSSSSGGGSTPTGPDGGAGGAGGADPVPTPTWWNQSFTHRIKITFDNTSRSTNLVNFTALITLDPSNFPYADAAPDAHDLRFIDSDGVTVLPFDIERWSPDKTSSIWVRVPKIRANLGTDHIWLYYGNKAANAVDSSKAVWSGHIAVYHLSDDPKGQAPQIHDSTSNNLDGTIVTADPTSMAGPAASALELLAGSHFSVGYIASVSMDASSARTVETWFKAYSTGSGFRTIFSKEDNCRGWRLALTAAGAVQGTLWLGTQCSGNNYTVTSIETSGQNYADDQWHHVAFVVSRAAAEMRLYVDGERLQTAQFQDMPNMGNGDVLFGDDESPNAHWYEGILDEIRISFVARSDDWVSADHASVRGTFAAFSSVEDVPPAP